MYTGEFTRIPALTVETYDLHFQPLIVRPTFCIVFHQTLNQPELQCRLAFSVELATVLEFCLEYWRFEGFEILDTIVRG